MVGNPPQTLPPEFRGDVTLSQQNKTTPSTDCKAAKACLDSSSYNHSPELSPPRPLSNAPTAGAAALSGSEKRADQRAEAPKLKADGAGVCPASQWSGGVKAGRDGNVTSGKNKKSQPHAVQSVPPALQCSAKFKPAQPVTFLPSTNFPSPLCKITLPPALGQIAALREAAASQFQKEIRPQGSGVGGAPLARTYPYPFSVGRTPAAEKKAGTSAAKLKSNHSTIKDSKSTGEQMSLASAVASPAIALPPQHPSLPPAAPARYTPSPTAAVCCGSALASIASQSRLLSHAEKSNSVDETLKTTPPSAADERTACALTTALSSSAGAQPHQKSGAGTAAVPHSAGVVSPAWQQQPHQASPAKRKIPRGSPKTKGAAASEGSTVQSGCRGPTHPEEETWERTKSPLSNLASIGKQQALDATAPAVEGNAEASRRADVLSQDAQPKPASAFEYPAYWSVEKWSGSPSRGDSTPAKKKPEKANATEPSENNAELNQGEHAGRLFGIASTNGNRLESRLAQVLEGEMLKKDISSDAPPRKKLDGMVASILTGQCAAGGDAFEKKTNGTKEELPPKAKAAAVKQKKTSPKKPAKEKSPADSSKKAAGKKKRDGEDPLTKVSCQKKQKKPCAPVQERSPSAGKVSPPSKAPTPRDKVIPNKAEQSARSASGRPRSTPLPERATQGTGQAAGADGETPAPKKRRRCRSKKYQTGEYITEKDKLEDGEHLEDSGVPAGTQFPSRDQSLFN
ncbi:hypothetical protein EYF80_016992 [Liparis tanakae]|uniref:BCL-6 corepressor-like protein 1 n=1 Tax=Liparis tanakae TaxID=230148 RepID=A0A4Z2I429_9TELE|nr:hypothetical protein EYF80_016992 [Liparis tanakae]